MINPNTMPDVNPTATATTYLSKSDFKVARTCPTKLYYKKLRYPTTLDDDSYMEMLADGGFMVAKHRPPLFSLNHMLINIHFVTRQYMGEWDIYGPWLKKACGLIAT